MQARWHAEAVGTVSRSGDKPMQALYLRCSVQLRRAVAPPAASDGHEPSGQPALSFQYELHVSQDLDDGTFHDPEEEAQEETIAVQDIAGEGPLLVKLPCTMRGCRIADPWRCWMWLQPL